jgi:hypothetical protein
VTILGKRKDYRGRVSAIAGTHARRAQAHQSKAVAVATGKAVANLVHASGKPEEAKYEVDLWFDTTELFDYRTAAEAFDW